MSDTIPARDRALIDAALTAGRVRHIPRGVSGVEAWVWCGETGRIRPPNGKKWTPFANKKRKRPVNEVNAQIASMWREGASRRAIAAAVHLSDEAVKSRVQQMRRKGVDLPRRDG